jgi:uncharacterized glyoxalase superfamily protein PhnB
MVVQIDMIGIVVKDMKKALAFYRMLDLPIPDGKENEDHVEVHSNGYRIAWDTEELIRGMYPDWIVPVGQRISLAFKCDSPQAVNELHQKLIDAGYKSHMAPMDAFWGQRYAVVDDPDGNHIDLFAQL